jgi:hypothetical protein
VARSFRYFGKKRGHRRTGSPALGRVGEAAFFAAMLVLGCGGLVNLISILIVPEWRVNHEFVETTCKVRGKSISERQGEAGPLYRPEIEIEYEVDGILHSDLHYDIHRAYSSGRASAQAVLDRFALYDKTQKNVYPCWYDPADPEICVLDRGYGWWVWLAFTVPLSFIVIGTGGLIYTVVRWGKSAERRAVSVQHAGEHGPLGGGDGDRQFPFVPQGADMTNSPGTKLKFRLPMTNSPGWALFGTLAFCVGWNGVVVFATILLCKLTRQPTWLTALFVAPFALVGLAAIGVFVRQLVKTAGIGPTLVEISDHPLCPGGRYRVGLSQSGRLMVSSLDVSLRCMETATYRQGTDTRIESREVYRQELFRREAFRIEGGLPLESEIELDVPEGAMHSFAADHNEINWTLVVEGDVAHWRGYRRVFPVIVRPGAGGLAR